MSAQVLKWQAYAQDAERKYHVPASVLLGLIEVESGGNEGETSGAGARGLTQFMPGTAPSYGVDVRPGGARSQIDGAAKYLNALGYQKDAHLALASYNGGPHNPQGAYADKVLSAAKNYSHLSRTPLPTSSAKNHVATSSSDSGGLLNKDRRNSLLNGLLTVAFVAGGAGAMWIASKHLREGAPA